MKNGGDDYKYFGAVEQLKIDVFNILKEAGLSIARDRRRPATFSIHVAEVGSVNPVFIDVNVEVTEKTLTTYHVRRAFTGTRIYYTGYAMSRAAGFSKNMRPTWDEAGRRWKFRSVDLVRKTQAALQHAANTHDFRKKRIIEKEAMEERIRTAFPAYDVPAESDPWERNLRLYGNRVEIETAWGEATLETQDGISFSIKKITFADSLIPVSVEAICTLLSRIFDIVGFPITEKERG